MVLFFVGALIGAVIGFTLAALMAADADRGDEDG